MLTIPNMSEPTIEQPIMPNVEPTIDNTLVNQPEPLVEFTEPQEGTQNKAAVEPTAKKHVVTFIANGTWYDQQKKAWSRSHPNEEALTTRTFSDEEYAGRPDLHFMVRYGAMTHVEV